MPCQMFFGYTEIGLDSGNGLGSQSPRAVASPAVGNAESPLLVLRTVRRYTFLAGLKLREFNG